jgi:hypothetical protein
MATTLLFAAGAPAGRIQQTEELRALLIERLANDVYKRFVTRNGGRASHTVLAPSQYLVRVLLLVLAAALPSSPTPLSLCIVHVNTCNALVHVTTSGVLSFTAPVGGQLNLITNRIPPFLFPAPRAFPQRPAPQTAAHV